MRVDHFIEYWIKILGLILITSSTVSHAEYLDSVTSKKTEDGIDKAIQEKQSFNQWKHDFRQRALSKKFTKNFLDKTFLDKVLKDLKPDPDVIKLDSSQPEFTKSIWQYLDNATSKTRLKKARKLLKKHRKILDKVESEYGVSQEIIVAIWAMESDFGANYGNKNVVRSLATLAHQGKRTEFAEQELLSALLILQNQPLDNKELIGSWAGAMGQTQFMPSSYLKYAVDYDNDGKRDLWRSLPDIFASIANFLSESDWLEQQQWGVEVKLLEDFDWHLNTVEHNLEFWRWQRLNVVKVATRSLSNEDNIFNHPDRQARLFIPAGKNGPVFLIAHNFDVIRQYNKSNSYALAVAQLSRLLEKGDSENIKAKWPREDKPLSYHQKEEIQVLLNMAGFDSGKIDGKIGSITQRAIHNWQYKQGIVADGYANLLLLKALRKQDADSNINTKEPH